MMNEDQLIGRQLASYRIDRFIGQGGMAQVYYAWDVSLERPAAVKVIRVDLRGDVSYAERFVQEARAISKWRHENVLQVYYAGQDDSLYFFAMEYVDGSNLEQILNSYGQKGELVPHDDVIWIGRAVASALDYAHSRHVIHRDVKPSNIMIDKENRVVLADFGLALDVQRGTLGKTFGTPHYVAPEQARNSADAVPQSDLYSLGIILYEMLTGVVPFDDPSSMSLALKHLTDPPPPPRSLNPNLSETVEQVLLKALAKEPKQRYESGMALLDALTDGLRAQGQVGESILALPPMPPVSALSAMGNGGAHDEGHNNTASPPVSRYSVVEQMRLSAPMPPPMSSPPPMPPTGSREASSPPPSLPTAHPSQSKPSLWRWLGLGSIGVVVFFVLALGLFAILRSGGAGEEVASGALPATEAPTAVVTSEAVVGETGDTDVTATAVDIIEPIPTDSLPAEATLPTSEPTALPTPAPTAEPTPVPPATEPAPAPTLVFPDGKRIELVYNEDSLYLYNTTSERIRVSTISFQAIDSNDRPLAYGMDGNRWTQFYSFVDAFACNRIEPFGADGSYLRPGYCRSYSATVTPARDGSEIFWRTRDGSTVFRVLWDGQEIGRCPVAPNSCEIFIP